LGLKHEPAVLVALAERFRADSEVQIVVVSEGRGVDWLVAEVRARGLNNVTVLPYQPYDRLPEVLATADVLVALLRQEAGGFSVPSKILSYLCAGRTILASVPRGNLAARTIERAGAGLLVEPGDVDGFLAAAEKLLGDERLRAVHAEQARSYAEVAFDIEAIAARFEKVVLAAARQRRGRQASTDLPSRFSSRRLGPSKSARKRASVSGSIAGRDTSSSLRRR
jgi:glycosyltransferase involved in cell wall biosynthesis